LSQQKSEIPCREMANDEIDLVDLFLIIWKRKWMIVAVTMILTIAAAGVSMVIPKVYAVTAILEPGKDADGKLIENPQAIRENIIAGSYDRGISEQLGIDLREMSLPLFKASVPKNTDLVKITVESNKPDKAVEMLNSLMVQLTADIEKKLDVKRNLLANELRAAKIEKNLYPKKMAQTEELIAATKKKILDLESARKKSISNNADAAMTTLLYLNEIQNQQVFLSSLYEKMSTLMSNQDKAELKIKELQIKQTAIRGTNITKKPSIPEKPIKPKKTLIVALAFVLGLMGGVMLAFFAEFMAKVRAQQAG